MRFEVVTTLADFAIVSYVVDPGALAKLLPPEFEPELLELADGTSAAFVSAVPFNNRDFRFTAFPLVRFAFAQTNYRTYVRYRGEPGVWFFGTTLASPLVTIPHFLWRLPWHHARTSIVASWDGERCKSYDLETRAIWGSARLSAGAQLDAEPFAAFADPDRAQTILTNPATGYIRHLDGTLGSYSVRHDRLRLKPLVANRARFDVFEQLDLVDPDVTPHSVLVTRGSEFSIFLPPRKVDVEAVEHP